MIKTGRILAAIGLVVASSLPAGAAPYQSHGLTSTSIQHDGVTAGLRFSMPFGGRAHETPEPRLSLGLDLYKSSSYGGDPFQKDTRRASLATLDFTGDGLQSLSLASRPALTTSYDPVDGSRKLDFFSPEPSTILWGAVVIATAVGIYLVVDENNSSSDTPAQ